MGSLGLEPRMEPRLELGLEPQMEPRLELGLKPRLELGVDELQGLESYPPLVSGHSCP